MNDSTPPPRGAGHVFVAVLLVANLTTRAHARHDPAQSRSPRIFGQVLRPDGSPAAGARVRVVKSRSQTVPLEAGRQLPEVEAIDVSEVTCDGDGSFRVLARPGELHALIAVDGDLMSELVAPVTAGDPVFMRLGPSRLLAGTVLLAEEGRGLWTADATRVGVRIGGHGPGAAVRAPAVRVETRCGPGGGWSVRVPLRSNCVVEVLAEARLGGGVLASARAEDAEVIQVMVLQPVRGRLVDRTTGNPVAGAQVRWFWENGTGPCAWSDEQGRFTLPRYAARELMHVVPVAHQHACVELTEPQASGREEVEVSLAPRAVRVTGRLLGRNGRPLRRARVLVSASVDETRETAWVRVLGEDGRLDVGSLHAGQLVSAFVEVDGSFVRFLTAAPGADLDLGDVRVSGQARVEGTVVGPDGAPVAGAVVLSQPALDELGPREAELVCSDPRATAADRVGRFVVSGLEPGACTLFALAPGFGPVRVEATAESGTVVPLRIGLGKGDDLLGSVEDETGRPVAGAWVRVFLRDGEDPVLCRQSWALPPVRTDEQGRFLLRGLDARHVDVDVSLTLDGKFVRRSVSLPARSEVKLVLEPRD